MYTDRRTVVLPEEPRPGKSKVKDTKRWCKGKVGREHEAEWVPLCTLWNSDTPQQREYDKERDRTCHFDVLYCHVCKKRIRLRETARN